MADQGLWFKSRDTDAFGAKGDQGYRHARGAARLAVGVRIANQDRARQHAARLFHGQPVGRRIRLAHCQCISAHQRRKKVTHAKAVQQNIRKTLGLIGADAGGKTGAAQGLNRRDCTGIKARMAVDLILVGVQQNRILSINLIFTALPRL